MQRRRFIQGALALPLVAIPFSKAIAHLGYESLEIRARWDGGISIWNNSTYTVHVSDGNFHSRHYATIIRPNVGMLFSTAFINRLEIEKDGHPWSVMTGCHFANPPVSIVITPRWVGSQVWDDISLSVPD